MASDSDSNYKTNRIKNLMMLTYQFKQIIVLDKCFGRNKKYRQYSKFKAMAIIYLKAQAQCDIENIGSIVNAFIIAIKIQLG